MLKYLATTNMYKLSAKIKLTNNHVHSEKIELLQHNYAQIEQSETQKLLSHLKHIATLPLEIIMSAIEY